METSGDLGELFARVGTALDIPDQAYDSAALKYADVGEWLAQESSSLALNTPEVYPQGSFRLGTVVRPITEKDEYDVDLVCRLNLDKTQTTQKNLKEMVGDRLREHPDLGKILKPCRRCWMLDYPSEPAMPQFHMDVLPAIPNVETLPTGILLTDTELTRWQKSNPKAFAEWFFDRMKVVFTERRAALAKSLQASIEEVPEWLVKTPLQRTVQILKRHRDMHFQGQENKPVSIIITTLAARTYRNQTDVHAALLDMVHGTMSNWGKPGFVENRSGRWWIENPVDSGENFADKWNDYPERREAFYQWMRKLQVDLDGVRQTRSLSEAATRLSSILGSGTMKRVSADMGLRTATSGLAIPVAQHPEVPALGDASHALRPEWPMQLGYRASVSGIISKKEHGNRLWDLSVRPIPKGFWIRFKVTTNVPSPYDIKWQVVNTGREAQLAHQLRGDYYKSEARDSSIRWESTKYTGTHWVEAFVIKNGTCVARSGRHMVRIR